MKQNIPEFVKLFDNGRHSKRSLGGHWFAGTGICQRCGLTKAQLERLINKEGKAMLSIKEKERIEELEAKAYFEEELSEVEEQELSKLIAKVKAL